ncbi:MAG: TraR/DksA C4-type zinc finger protein [Actinomycetota bacterium]|nr:TraR/DksA C4-type zinc finger protein [Actinomycetota bacterium]
MVAKKSPVKPPAKKAAVAKKAPAKAVAKKAVPVKKAVVAKKAVPAKKVAPAKKAAPVKKTTPVAKKAAPVKAVAKKVAPAKKAAPVKAVAKKAAPVKKAAPAKKAVVAKAVAAPAVVAPAPVAPVKKAVPAKKPVKRQLAPSGKPMVREDESPWTAVELKAVRAALILDVKRLEDELDNAEAGLADLIRDSGEGAGDDQADAGSKTFEREHEMSLANNARDMLVQVTHAIARLDTGTYGACESCGKPIGKYRLQAFPRATLCLVCKQADERLSL